MPGSWEIWLNDNRGRRIADPRGQSLIADHKGFSVSLRANKPAPFELRIPPSFDPRYIGKDFMVEFWRYPAGRRAAFFQVYFVRFIELVRQHGESSIIVKGYDPKHLLSRRIVAAYANETQSAKTDYADDMMKEVVTESEADGVDPTPTYGTRAWSLMTVAGDDGLGPSITKGMAFKKLMELDGTGILPDIANEAKERGHEVFFDVVPVFTPSGLSFQFRTAIDQPRPNLRQLVVFSDELGTLSEGRLVTDYRDEFNSAYAGGVGTEDSRNVQQAYNESAHDQGPFGRIEEFVSATHVEDDNDQITAVARTALTEGLPQRYFSCVPLDVAPALYGVHWGYGNRVGARFWKQTYEGLVRGVTITVTPDEPEAIQPHITWEAAWT